MADPVLLYGLIYEKPITKEIDGIRYTTRSLAEAREYANTVFPDATIVSMTIVDKGA
jgi:hypothetical protein